MTREKLAEFVKQIRDKEKCPHCGGDIKDFILMPHERDCIKDTIRGRNGDLK